MLENGVGLRKVGLVDDEHVRDLKDAGLDRLHVIAGARDVDDDRRVRRPCDLHLVLASPHRLDDDHVFACGVHHVDDVVGRRRKAAERSLESLWNRIACLLDEFQPDECTNYFRNSGYAAC